MSIDNFDIILKVDIEKLKNNYITPLEKRYKKSKFAKMLKEMNNTEIQALAYCLLVSQQVKNAIDCYSHTVDNNIQLFALDQEFRKRFKY